MVEQMPPNTCLVLRTCESDLTSWGGFQWPESGPVYAIDWAPVAKCGHGLHGFLWGEGDAGLALRCPDAKWLVVEVDVSQIVNLGGKVKFPRGVVVHCGDRLSATNFLRNSGCHDRKIIGGIFSAADSGLAIAGDRGKVTAGDYGEATTGHNGQATAGEMGKATAGDCGEATAGHNGDATAGHSGHATAGSGGKAKAGAHGVATCGNYGEATAGDHGKATAGDYGKATAGDYGQATAGYNGAATAGHRGWAIAGDWGSATAGAAGTATAGRDGFVSAGDGGAIQGAYLDRLGGRMRILTGYIGENGLRPNVQYMCADGVFQEGTDADLRAQDAAV